MFQESYQGQDYLVSSRFGRELAAGHNETIQAIIEKCLPYSSDWHYRRIPGAGKSTFIVLGICTEKAGRWPCWLLIQAAGKPREAFLVTRPGMRKLSTHPDASGLHHQRRSCRKTGVRTIILAKRQDLIIVVERGVGRSETASHSMVDFLLLSFREPAMNCRGIKRGIIEMR